jgi:hypothetical protein
MDYDIKEVDLFDPVAETKVTNLLRVTFNSDIHSQRVRLNTWTKSTVSPSLYLGAFIGEELIGFNGFISHDLIWNGDIVNCHQSCWTATNPNHRGKRIFNNLIEEAKAILKERGSAFILGFPNADSGAIFTSELGFTSSPMSKALIPSNWLLPTRNLRHWSDIETLVVENSYSQNEHQLIVLKKQESGGEILVVEDYHNLIWGRMRKRKAGPLTLSYFDCGGMIINNPHFFGQLVAKLVGVYKPTYIQFVMHHTNQYAALFKQVRPAMHTEPLVLFDLKRQTADARFNLFAGAKDIF